MHRDKYKEGFRDGSEKVAEKSRRNERLLRKNLEETRKYVKDLEDASKNRLFFRQKIKDLISGHKEKMVPMNFDIKIVHDNDAKYADDIRKTLNGYGNSAFCVRAKEYRECMSNTVDYTVLIGDVGKEVTRRKHTILDRYGCYMAVAGNQIVLMNNPASIDSRNAFLEFYKRTVKRELYYGEQAEDVRKILKVRDQEEEQPERAMAFYEKFCDGVAKIADKIEDKSKAAGMVFVVCCLPATTTLGLMILPVGISETVFREISRKLKEDKYDKEMIPLAQKQVLQITLCNYIKEQQIKYASAR